jgi:hypothetical protein
VGAARLQQPDGELPDELGADDSDAVADAWVCESDRVGDRGDCAQRSGVERNSVQNFAQRLMGTLAISAWLA